MPKMSKASAPNVEDYGPGTEWHDELDGYKASFVEVSEDTDLTPLLQGLPNDQCQCPHWGTSSRAGCGSAPTPARSLTDRATRSTFPPATRRAPTRSSEFVIFSPSEQIAEVEAHMARRAQEL